MHSFHELNELYDGTINQFHHFAFSSIAIESNKVFTYHKATKEAYVELFIATIPKEIYDHESRNHWTIVKRSYLPSATKKFKLFGVSSASIFRMVD